MRQHIDGTSSKTAWRQGHPVRLALVILLTCVACLTGAILAINTSPRLLVTLLGFDRFGPLATALPPEPAPLRLSGKPLDHVDIVLSPQVPEPLPLTSSDVSSGKALSKPLIGDASTPGVTRYLLDVDESSVNRLLWELVLPDGTHSNCYRDVAVDLQPGGLIIYADVDLGIRWQRMGLLLQHAGTETLSLAGVVLNGTLYTTPASDSLAQSILPAGRRAQQALHALMLVGPLPGEAHVEDVRFHQDRLQILAQASYAALTLPDTGWRTTETGLEVRGIDVAVAAGRPTERLSIVRLHPANFRVRVHYDPDKPKTISAWAAALDTLLVVNGSFFAPESEGRRETIALLVSDGQRWGTPLGDYAGMLAVAGNGEVSIRWLRHRPYDPEELLTQAMQSFPVLVKPGGTMGFPADGDDGAPARRTVVAQDDEGNILLAVAARGTLSLHELAIFLAESDLVIDVALNLDGGGSSGMWLTTADAPVEIDSYTPVPSVIAVERR